MEEKLWHLRDHQSATGRRDVRNDYDRASDELKAAFDTHWEFLEVRPRDQWVRPEAHKLRPERKGGYREFFEFRFFAENRQQRPIGYFGQGQKHFTLLLWAIEKGNKFVPPEAVGTCETRRDGIVTGGSESVAWDEDEEDETDKARKTAAQDIPRRLR
jgi:hypothetical protein